MRSGRSNQLTKQLGEYLVVAELARRGLLATTFTGNVPHYDILATGPDGHPFAIQVKTIKGGSWQFDISQFIEVELVDGDRQVLGNEKGSPHPGLICVFVVASSYGADRFFVFDWLDLQRVVVHDYRRFLDEKGGVRPKRHDSFHTAVAPEDLAQFENNWALIELGAMRRRDQ